MATGEVKVKQRDSNGKNHGWEDQVTVEVGQDLVLEPAEGEWLVVILKAEVKSSLQKKRDFVYNNEGPMETFTLTASEQPSALGGTHGRSGGTALTVGGGGGAPAHHGHRDDA